jgi:hypothetical protein
MIRMGDHHELVFAPGYDIDRVVRNGTLYQRHVGTGLEEKSEHRAGVGAGGADADRGVSQPKAAEDGRKHVRGDGGTSRNAERSPLEASELAELTFGYAFDAEQLAGAGVEGTPGLREIHSPGSALDERDVELPL